MMSCTIPLGRTGLVALVDSRDYDALAQYTWTARLNPATGSYYAVRAVWVERDGRRFRSTIQMAREILGLGSGDPRQADHVDHNTLDNRRVNLRIASRAENCRNRRRRSDNVVGYKGVSQMGSRWRAQIWLQGTNVLIGAAFPTPEAAARAYDERARIEHGAFALVNFPTDPAPAQLPLAA